MFLMQIMEPDVEWNLDVGVTAAPTRPGGTRSAGSWSQMNLFLESQRTNEISDKLISCEQHIRDCKFQINRYFLLEVW
jgi:hypothetical protein